MESIPLLPWAGMSFVYDIESDELADALRSAFPEHRTLRERKHAAVIRLFEQELREMHSSTKVRWAHRSGKTTIQSDQPRE